MIANLDVNRSTPKAMAYLVLLAPGQESRLRMLSGQAMSANSYSWSTSIKASRFFVVHF